ncbi:S8 family serine peptidase [Paenibacillus lactis]|uniref:Peptidase S8 and S53 subtilisin kexin sedolisin n=1 Tax=Paenibacillus lactis 154 TaxID=743719 RepID=G4HM50_9BACL|nr:S8 family serine peptidase [Paenibacillus lactis]EHB54602.1 peptidase S8 and S53 subtilisin kexin sedolisin [Paenibacillus lactis 154]
MSKRWLSILLSLLLALSLVVPAAAAPISGEKLESGKFTAEQADLLEQTIERRAQQLADPVLDQSLLQSRGSVNVIVELSEEPVALSEGISSLQGKSFSSSEEKKVREAVQLEQQTFIRNLDRNQIDYTISNEYHYALNGISLEVNSDQLEALAEQPGVLGVYPDLEVAVDPVHEVSPYMKDTGPFIGAPDVWNLGYTGKGVKVGVIDTGIDYLHPNLKDAYKGGYDFVNNDEDPYETTPQDHQKDPTNPKPVDDDGRTYWTDHGTHVAGTVAAREGGEYGVKGIAPEAELYAYKVLGPYGSGKSSWVLGGIDRAVQDGMDVINLSLGNSLNDPEYITSIALNNAMLAGVTAVVASGNSGPQRWTVGSPGAAALPITVGNSTGPQEEVRVTSTFFTDPIQPATLSSPLNEGDAEQNTPATVTTATYPPSVTSDTYETELMAWNLAVAPEDVLDGDFGLVYVGLGSPEDFEGKDMKGKIALIKRGELPFVDKMANAQKAGATAAIIYNNVDDSINPIPYFGDSFSFLTTLKMSLEEGEYIRQRLEAEPDLKVNFSDFKRDRTEGDEINSSSSRGPAQKTLDIKPDVVAPGTSILSSIPAYGKDDPDADYSKAYDRLTGTSMAAPHVAGLAALILQKNPEWTPFDVKVALMNNAKVLDTDNYDVNDQGAGRVQALKTIQATELVKVLDKTSYTDRGVRYEQDNITGSINFGNFTGTTEETTITKKIRVESLNGLVDNFRVEVEPMASRVTPGVTVTVDQPAFTLDGQVELEVSLNVPKGISSTSEHQGHIVIISDVNKYYVPYAAYFNLQKVGINYIDTFTEDEEDLPHFKLDDQGELDNMYVAFELYNQMNLVILDLYDALNTEAGEDGDGVIGQIFGARNLQAGPYYMEWDGTYLDSSTGEPVMLKDGLYSIDLSAQDSSLRIFTDYVRDPFFVKRTAPKIVIDAKTTIHKQEAALLKGTVDDLYVTAAPVLKEDWFIDDFDVSEWLDAKYTIKRANKSVAKEGSFDVEQDGAFTIPLDGLSSGNYTVELSVKDRQGLEGTATVDLQLTGAPGPGNPDPGNPGGGSGGGGGSSSGGGSTTPSTPAPEVSGDAKVTTKKNTDGTESAIAALSETAVSAGIAGDGKEVKLDVSKLDFTKYSDVAFTLNKATVDKLKASGKPLVIQGNGFALTVPADALDDFTTASGFNLTVSVAAGKAGNPASLNVVSPLVTVKHADKFKHSILLTLNYDSAKVKDARKVGAYMQSATGDMVSAGLLHSAAKGSITFRIYVPASYVAAENSVTFNDISGHWAKDEIEVAASQHVTYGTGAGRFSPNTTITRAEFATLLDRIFETGIDWDTRSKEAGAKNPLTRVEMVTMIADALKVESEGGQLSFSDAKQIPADARAAVAFAVEQGLVKGMNGNRFAPEETSTRAQVSVIVYRLLDYLNKI